jgi:hypothetical protein
MMRMDFLDDLRSRNKRNALLSLGVGLTLALLWIMLLLAARWTGQLKPIALGQAPKDHWCPSSSSVLFSAWPRWSLAFPYFLWNAVVAHRVSKLGLHISDTGDMLIPGVAALPSDLNIPMSRYRANVAAYSVWKTALQVLSILSLGIVPMFFTLFPRNANPFHFLLYALAIILLTLVTLVSGTARLRGRSMRILLLPFWRSQLALLAKPECRVR